jgi:uncharacterized membrane protein
VYCGICGDERVDRKVYRVWSADDGWQIIRLCGGCKVDALKARPNVDDYAYDKAGDYVADIDEAITTMFG